MKLLYIDLFCGAGGTSTGVENARYEGRQCAKVIGCVNHDANAIASHAANHPDALHFEEKSEGGGRSKGGAACMILFCPFEQMHYYIELGQRYGLKRYIPLVFRKDFSAQVLKANMKVVGNCEYGLILYRDRLPKFNNDGRMIFNCFDWVRDTDTPKIHPTQKPVPLLERLIEIFTDKGDVVIDPCAGSGTTLLAAANMGRKAYGFEIKKDFCAEARVKVLPRISKSLFV